MTCEIRLTCEREPVPQMAYGTQYAASSYMVLRENGTEPLWATMQVDATNVIKWINQVGRCFELAALSYDRETQMMTATFRPGNGLALIAHPKTDREQP